MTNIHDDPAIRQNEINHKKRKSLWNRIVRRLPKTDLSEVNKSYLYYIFYKLGASQDEKVFLDLIDFKPLSKDPNLEIKLPNYDKSFRGLTDTESNVLEHVIRNFTSLIL